MKRGIFGRSDYEEINQNKEPEQEEEKKPDLVDWFMSKDRWWNKEPQPPPEPTPEPEPEPEIEEEEDRDFYINIEIHWGG